MDRKTYTDVILKNLQRKPQMVFLTGARQVGKTTLSQQIATHYERHAYFNWDVDADRLKIISGQNFIEEIFPIEIVGPKPLVIFDEIHKYKNWKNYLKGFYDLYKNHYDIIVTGSSRLDIFQKGGDSLMGRYISFTVNPLSLGEVSKAAFESFIRFADKIDDSDYDALYEYGGYPDPYLWRTQEDYNQWSTLRNKQLFREDIRDLTNIHEVSQLELCSLILQAQAGSILNRTNIAKKIQVSVQTIGRWINTLEQFYFCFKVFPYSKNIPNSLIKEPMIYLNDWSMISDTGAHFENFVACHLKKAINFWNESGKGIFDLFFLRDKAKREVDFIITQDQKPWILVECKKSNTTPSKALRYFHGITKAPFAFQVVESMPFVEHDCFKKTGLYVVPAKTFLSQLV